MNASHYLADDVEARLRMSAPLPCRLCDHLLVKVSAVLDRPVCGCRRANALIERLTEAPAGLTELAGVVDGLLLDQARRHGTCRECAPLGGLAAAQGPGRLEARRA
ncbi:MAG: hypothetical protein MZW92_49400 [Comamonadaceae bacterium]|nr:hypothetical protein [Comamonadaceae bacterium]